jgi:hypothetical protein
MGCDQSTVIENEKVRELLTKTKVGSFNLKNKVRWLL